jgi:Protein of unknown function (DUF1826)
MSQPVQRLPVTVLSTCPRPSAPTGSCRYDDARLRYESVGRSVRVAESAGVFEQLFEEEVQLCIWKRASDEILGAYLDRAVCPGGWERRMEVSIAEPSLAEAVQGLLAGFEGGLGRVRLTTELLSLIDLFATLSDSQRVGVRMVATERRTCPRFHADAVGLRLLCTWVGEGTEWVAEEEVIRPDTGSAAGPVRAGAAVHQMPPFAVGVFKGDLWPGNDGCGAVHRSPQPTGWRVFVSLDGL